MQKRISTKALIIIMAAVLAVCSLACVLILNNRRKPPVARVTSGGKLIKEIYLDTVAQEYSFTVECEEGYNIVTVRQGEICVSDADCPDHICMQYGWIKGTGAPIVCMPHRLVISFEEDTDVDMVSG